MPSENADELLKIEQQALGILEAADAEAEATILSAILANGGIDPGPHDLDISGVRYAKEKASQIQQKGSTDATKLLYDAHAERMMTRASRAEGFIATLDIVLQSVVEVLKGRTDRAAMVALRQKWSTNARDRAAAGWFVARSPKVTLGAPITDPTFWSDLERRFRDLGEEFDDRLTANWISSVWGEEGHQWSLNGPQGRERQMFEALAERAAVGLGHPLGIDALFFWLDWLKRESASFHLSYQGSDGDGNTWQAGIIRRPCEASADQCFKQESRVMSRAIDVARLSHPQLLEDDSIRGVGPSTLEAQTSDEPVSEEVKLPGGAQRPGREVQPEIQTAGRGPDLTRASTVAPSALSAKPDFLARQWEEVEIRFLSDERLQIIAGEHTETRNYAEFGFEDRRSKAPNLAWVTLRSLAEAGGTIRRPNNGQDWPSVEKRMQEIRRIFRNHFKIDDDPLPFIEGAGYRARFKISCAPSFNS